ncbi:MAG: M4 family metallopeptidase [Pseudomonadota bacterium]
MCRHTHHRNALFCIIPPYMLDQIVSKGSPEQRTKALHTLAMDNTFRALRLAAPPLAQAEVPQPLVSPHKRRTVFTADGSQELPGSIVRVEGQGPTGDPAIDEAYDGLGATYDFFWEVLERNSIDGAGMPLDATVHFGHGYNNAFWNSMQMVFGDGDGEIFNRFTIALDIIGHELAHGVTEDEAQLQYFNQSGALNESMSDVFGTLIKQFALRQNVEQADWLIGEGLLMPGINGRALRSMSDPGSAFDDDLLGKDPQPKHMRDFVVTYEDNGGVHINSSIPNHAFFHTANQLGGFAWEKAGRIWYEALRDSRLKPNSGFRRFAGLTEDIAQRLFGHNSAERKAVTAGWSAVGIKI